MKIETYTRCVHCGKMLSLESPPSAAQCEAGEVHVEGNSMILLSEAVAKRRKDGTHARGIDGHYCDVDCLIARLKLLRAGEEKPR